MAEWISVKDRLPAEAKTVLVYVRRKGNSKQCAWACVTTDMWTCDGWLENTDERFREITYWMPLPNPPKEDA